MEILLALHALCEGGITTGYWWIFITSGSIRELWCFILCSLEQVVEQTNELSVVWNAMTPIYFDMLSIHTHLAICVHVLFSRSHRHFPFVINLQACVTGSSNRYQHFGAEQCPPRWHVNNIQRERGYCVKITIRRSYCLIIALYHRKSQRRITNLVTKLWTSEPSFQIACYISVKKFILLFRNKNDYRLQIAHPFWPDAVRSFGVRYICSTIVMIVHAISYYLQDRDITGDHFTFGFSIAIQIRLKFCFTLASILTQWSQKELHMARQLHDRMASSGIKAGRNFRQIWIADKNR